ncbi:hypothetical protein CSKR_114023 [Clonorchis sinensis]|uniref:Uncharacterized protein n=1 Tax=Clonorchis sinensis TaxID=79923 RepID=A0A3R7FEA1_CLOSI|nr:hypothetical protein CSKR_114023 [Clonorchis sinensis]
MRVTILTASTVWSLSSCSTQIISPRPHIIPILKRSVYGHINMHVPNTTVHSIDLPQSLLLPVNQHRLAKRNKAYNSRHSRNAIMLVSFANSVSP